jgi:hypothetical protein
MDKETNIFQMDSFIKVNILMVCHKVMDNIFGKTVAFIKAILSKD